MKNQNIFKDYNLIHIVLGLTIGFFMGGALIYYGVNRQNVSFFYKDIASLEAQKKQAKEDPGQAGKTPNDYNSTNNSIQPEKASNIRLSQSRFKQNEFSNIAPDTLVSSNEQPSKTASGLIVSQSTDNTHKDVISLYDKLKKAKKEANSETSYDRVVKDEHILTKAMQKPLGFKERSPASSYPELDSMLGKNGSNPNKNYLLVEFWESPLKSKGYKKGNNKIILYGITLYDFVSFRFYNDTLYLKYLNQFYPLEFTPDFKSLKPVSDLALIDKLQQL